MLKQFRFKISCQESGEVIVDCRIAFFRGETLLKKAKLRHLLAIPFRLFQCGRMLGTEGALLGLQSSPVERFCIFQLAHASEALCQIVD